VTTRTATGYVHECVDCRAANATREGGEPVPCATHAFREFARAASAPRDYETQPCTVCLARVGEGCNLEVHAELEGAGEPDDVDAPTVASTSPALLVPLLEAEPADLEAFVAQLDVTRIPPTVVRLRQVQKLAGEVADKLEARWGLDTGGLGWVDQDTKDVYTYTQSRRGSWSDIPGMVSELLGAGMSARQIAEAVSDLRVTALKDAINTHGALQKRKELLAIVDEHRGHRDRPAHFAKLEEDKPHGS
jgi:hypothetical protein